jgi:hypothetical protein
MKTFITVLAATAGLAIWTSPVDAGGDHHRVEVTTGHFQTLPGAGDDDVRGGAIMFRSDRDGGRTTVFVHVRGLDSNRSYPTHVHNRPCAADPAGGSHYQNVTPGPVDSVNEIWPTISTRANGTGFGYAVHAARARHDAMSIVVHNPDDTSIRLACVDLT